MPLTSVTQPNCSDSTISIGFQFIVNDVELSECSKSYNSLQQCLAYLTLGGKCSSEYRGPPAGGWAYEYWASYCPNSICAFTSAIQDYWPMYYDEFFAPSGPTSYVASPAEPEYLYAYQQANRIVPQSQLPALPLNPSQAFGFLFSDRPTTTNIVPGSTAGQVENASFVTALVGVTGTCNQLVYGGCNFQIIPGTTFQWNATDGGIGYPQLNAAQKLLAFPILSPGDLTGIQLTNSLISINQFFTMANLTPATLAAVEGGIASISAALIPSQAVLLCDFDGNGTVNMSEVQDVVNQALGTARAVNDLNADGVVNIVDVQIEINAALGLGCAAQ